MEHVQNLFSLTNLSATKVDRKMGRSITKKWNNNACGSKKIEKVN